MNYLTQEELANLTEHLNRRFAEFEGHFDALTLGQVRAIYGWLEEWTEQCGCAGRDAVKTWRLEVDPETGRTREVPPWEVDADSLQDTYHFAFARGREAERKEAGMEPPAQGPRMVTHSAPAADDEGEPMPPIEDHIRTILARWLQLMGALAEDLQECDNAVGAGQLLAEILTLRTTFDLYDAAGIGELAAHWPDLAHVEEGDDVFAEHLHPEGSRGAPDAPQKSDENLTSEEPPTAPPKRYPAGSRKSTVGEPAALSLSAATTLGPEHTMVTPLPNAPAVPRQHTPAVNGQLAAISKPRTLAEADADAELDALRMGSEEKAAALREVLTELQIMSEDGKMPSIGDWDRKRPPGMISASGLMKRHELMWSDFARYAKLTPNRGRGGK